MTSLLAVAVLLSIAWPSAQGRGGRGAANEAITLLRPARVFDGDVMHEGWAVRVKGERIDAAGPEASVAAAGATTIDLPGTTLTPGLIEGHSHILLHAYSETSWTDQVSK
jgi:imidazolonepropionase-like amidohydrolase